MKYDKKYSKKYNKETVDIFIECLDNGSGRVNAAKAANISYQCFLNWMKDETKSDFQELVKNSEYCGKDQNKENCKQKILKDPSWQSAAWWLERNHPEEFGKRQEINHSGKVDSGGIIVKAATKEDIETVQKFLGNG